MKTKTVTICVFALVVFVAAATSSASTMTFFRNHLHNPGSKQWEYATSGAVRSDPELTHNSVLFGSSDNNLYAVDRFSGALNWTVTTGDRIYGSPTVSESLGRVFFGGNDGIFRAVSLKDGSLLWSVNISDPIISKPAIFNSAGTCSVIFGAFDANVYSLDCTTGAQNWNFTTEAFVSAAPVLAPQWDLATYVLIGSQDGYVYAIDASNGGLVWKVYLHAAVNYACTLKSDFTIVYCSAKHGVFALNTGTGAKEWSIPVAGTVTSRMAITSDSTLLFFPADYTKIYAIQASNGAAAWSYDQKTSYLQTAPAVHDGVLYFGTGDSNTTLLAFGAKNGSQIWKFSGGGGAVTTRVVVDDRNVVFGTSGGKVYSLNPN